MTRANGLNIFSVLINIFSVLTIAESSHSLSRCDQDSNLHRALMGRGGVEQ